MSNKKLVSLLALVSILGLSSCNKENPNSSTVPSSSSSSSSIVLPSTSSSSSSSSSVSSTSSSAVTSTSSTSPKVVEVEQITVTESSLSLEVGENATIGYEVLPSDATDKSVSFEYDESIISLDKSTLSVTGIAEGQTTIVISSSNGKSASIAVTVSPASVEVVPTAISTEFARSVIGEGETLKIDVKFYPAETTLRNLRFKSSDPSVISVNSAQQTITGVAASYKTITITISSTDNTLVNPIRLTLKVSNDEAEIKNDKATASLNLARQNEQNNLTGGTITISSKYTNSEPRTYTNTFEIYDDHTYNQITDYDGNKYMEYHGFDSSRYYEVKYTDGKVTGSSYNSIIEDGTSSSFSSDITYSTAKKSSNLPALLAHTYSSKYTYGITEYLDDNFFDTIYENYVVDVDIQDDSVTFSYNMESYAYKTIYKLVMNFDGDNYKSVYYDELVYNYSDLDDDFNPVSDSVEPRTFNKFYAEVTTGARQEDKRTDKIDPSKFYFKDFTLSFYKSTDTERKNPLTSFERGDTIVYEVESSDPSQAIQNIDPIYAWSSSNTDAIDISQNHFALNAVGAGESEIVFKTIYSEFKITLSVTVPSATDIKISELPSSMRNTETESIFIQAEPYGALDDFKIYLKEGDEQYAKLTKVTDSYYTISGYANMDVKEKDVTIIVESESNPSLHKEVTIKIMKALSAKEIQDILIDGAYVGAANEDYYNYYVKCIFTNEYQDDKGYIGEYTIYRSTGKVFSKFTFYYTIANSKLTILSTDVSNDYVSTLSIDILTPDCLSLYSSFKDLLDSTGDGEYTVTYSLTKEASNNE